MIKHRSENYNYNFDTTSGFFMRWGKTLEDDPDMSPIGPEIADIELSTICSSNCPWCYKGNTERGEKMPPERLAEIFTEFPSVMQVAFGIGDLMAFEIDEWKEYFKICSYHNVVPNVTLRPHELPAFGSREHSLSDVQKYEEYLALIAQNCGAVAVSYYGGDIEEGGTRWIIQRLREESPSRIAQINIHQIFHSENYADCINLLVKIYTDKWPVNAVVFLKLKPIGRGINLQPETDPAAYRRLVNVAQMLEVGVGFDSCSAHHVIDAFPNDEQMHQLIEPCESGLFSIYVDVHGAVWPCSFCEGDNSYGPWPLSGVWNSDKMKNWREELLAGKRECPLTKHHNKIS